MNKETQDLIWACLPKEVRDEIRKRYKAWVESVSFETENILYEDLFGSHNLTSDTEPEEMLMISLKKVKALYEDVLSDIENSKRDCDNGSPSAMFGRAIGMKQMLLRLFGDKCLPDKIQDTGFGGMSLTPPACKLDVKPEQPSVQVEPRFKVGDKVRIIKQNHSLYGKTAIVDVPMKDAPEILVNRMGNLYSFYESELEPYAEPEYRNLSQEIANCDKSETNNLKDNMEEKELNLLDIINDSHIGETFYSLIEGYVKFEGIEPHWKEYGMKPLSFAEGNFNPDGTYQTKSNASCCIWPSKELYEKYPLDPVKAWSIWASERKPRFKFEVYLSGYDNGVMMADIAVREQFQFKTYEEIMQAAEAVRETLMKFHEQNQK